MVIADRLGFVVLLGLGLSCGVGFAVFDIRPLDANIFWTAAQSAHYYGTTWGADAGSFYVYPPPLAQLLGLIPWLVFVVVWMTLLFVGFWFATRWWGLPVLGGGVGAGILLGHPHIFANPILLTLVGNPQVLLAAAIVVGFRWPAAWALVLLTKIAPGIGLLWFAVRGEWRSLGIALGATALIAGVSFVLAPGAWGDWLRFAVANAGTPSPQPVVQVPFALRIATSAALIVWGARTNRRWTVPIAAGWSAIALYEASYVTMWVAGLVLLNWRAPVHRSWTGARAHRPAADAVK